MGRGLSDISSAPHSGGICRVLHEGDYQRRDGVAGVSALRSAHPDDGSELVGPRSRCIETSNPNVGHPTRVWVPHIDTCDL